MHIKVVVFFSMLRRFVRRRVFHATLALFSKVRLFHIFCAHSSCPFILVNMAEEEVARLVVGDDSGTYRAYFAGDDTPRACPVPVGDDTELDQFCLVRLPL